VARNRWHQRIASANDPLIDLKGPRTSKARLCSDYLDPELLEAFARVVRGNRGDHALHVGAHFSEIDSRLGVYAESGGRACAVRLVADGKQGFGRHAAAVQAFAAHAAAFDQHHACAELRGRSRSGKPRRSRADDTKVRRIAMAIRARVRHRQAL
jgi:hypothetical protein